MNEAEDLAQIVFVESFRRLKDFDPARSRFSTWLFMIARSRSLNTLQKKSATLLAELPEQYAATTKPEDRDRMEILDRALHQLPGKQKRAFTLVALTLLTAPLGIGIALSIRENFLHLFVMAGSSMSPTLDTGDRIFVRKDSYRDRQPVRNNLVAFLNPENRKQTWVKRVIALPGDVLEIKSGVVHIKEASGVRNDKFELPPITIPEHHCYVLGDNRVNSRDSRHIGPVPIIALVGEVVWWR